MAEWKRVKWSEASQVIDTLAWFKLDPAARRAAPKDAFDGLVAKGRLHDAAHFLAQALPRFEAVAWAARCVRELRGEAAERTSTEAAALKGALQWLQDPTDARRRAVGALGDVAQDSSPERYAALAVFYSGGSLAPAEYPAVPAPKDIAGLYAAAAVITACEGHPDGPQALQRCLDQGERIAAHGAASA